MPEPVAKPRDLVWMIMHVVYVEAEFGLWQLSRTNCQSWIRLRFLNGCLEWAIEANDFDMLGELVDCLRCAETRRYSWVELMTGQTRERR